MWIAFGLSVYDYTNPARMSDKLHDVSFFIDQEATFELKNAPTLNCLHFIQRWINLQLLDIAHGTENFSVKKG